MKSNTLYGLFRCTHCGFEELKRVPVYRANVAHNYQTRELISIFGEFVTLGGRITYDCVAPWYQDLDLFAPCDGEMVLDTRYNFAGLLACKVVIIPSYASLMNALRVGHNGACDNGF